MNDIKINLVFEKDLTTDQKSQIDILGKECFGDVPQEEIDKDFIAESFARILIYNDNKLIGHARLFKRNIEFEGENIILGGIGGVCVTESARGQGIASQMLEKGLEILKKQQCDMAILNVDRKKGIYSLYEKFGFKFLNRDISYENADGKICYDGDSMLIAINSHDKYNMIINSKNILHQGKGYW